MGRPTPSGQRILYAENVRLRELLVAAAQDVERLACDEPRPERRDALLRRAMRVRRRLVDCA